MKFKRIMARGKRRLIVLSLKCYEPRAPIIAGWTVSTSSSWCETIEIVCGGCDREGAEVVTGSGE
jgi:hypothetical protein